MSIHHCPACQGDHIDVVQKYEDDEYGQIADCICLDCEYPFSTQVDVDYSDVELGDECDDCTIVDEE